MLEGLLAELPAADPRAAGALRHRPGADAALLPRAGGRARLRRLDRRASALLEHKAELARTAWESALAAGALCASASSSSATRPGSSTSRPRSSWSTSPTTCAALAAELRDDYAAYLEGARTSSPTAPRSASSRRRCATRSGSRRRWRRLELADDDPARDPRYFASSFYWPDVLDPAYPYGEGVALQLRSAVSHLNEVWAVDTAGRILARALARARLGVHAATRRAGSTTRPATC